MTTFKRGDKALFQGEEVQVLHGPERGNTGDRYMIRDGRGCVVVSGELEPLPTSDTRRDVVAKAMCEWDGDLSIDVARYGADAVLAALDAHASSSRCPVRFADGSQCTKTEGHWDSARMDPHTPEPSADAPARYRDCDGDVWEVQADGRPLFVKYASGSTDVLGGDYYDSVSDLIDAYGPLTRI